jgi:peptide/nickel transport system permease protein
VIPGLGTVLLNAVAERDLPVVQGLAVVFGVLAVVLNLGADLVTHRFAPRAGVAA